MYVGPVQARIEHMLHQFDMRPGPVLLCRHAAYIASLPTHSPKLPFVWHHEQARLLGGTAVADKLDGVGASTAALPKWGPVTQPPAQASALEIVYSWRNVS